MALNTIDTVTVKKELPIFTVKLPELDVSHVIEEYKNLYPENYNKELPNAPVRSSWRSNMWAMDYPKLKSFVSIVTKCCLLYTSDAADDLLCVDLGGRRII